MALLGIAGILLLHPSVISQPLSITNILSNKINWIEYLPLSIIGFLWGFSPKYFTLFKTKKLR